MKITCTQWNSVFNTCAAIAKNDGNLLYALELLRRSFLYIRDLLMFMQQFNE